MNVDYGQGQWCASVCWTRGLVGCTVAAMGLLLVQVQNGPQERFMSADWSFRLSTLVMSY